MLIRNGRVSARLTISSFQTAAIATASLLLFFCGTAAAQQQTTPGVALTIRSAVLEQLLKDSRSEQQPVSKTLLRSEVTGCQTTLTNSQLHILPNSRPLQFEVRTHGTVSSQTTGVNPQAVVESNGSHRFEVVKPFWFDGRRFLTRPSHGTIEAWQNPQRVFSSAGARMPLLAPLTDQVAWNRVRQMQPQINQAVALDLSKDIFPQVDRRVEQEFVRLQDRWLQAQQVLQQWYPEPWLEWSALARADSVLLTTAFLTNTLTHDAPTARRQDPASLDASPVRNSVLAATALQPTEDIVLTVSEVALTELVATAIPGGSRITDTQLQRLTELLPKLITGQPESLAELAAITADKTAPATFFTLELPPSQPCIFSCSEGDLQVNFRFRILPLIGTDSGWMTTTLFLRGKRLNPDTWTITVRDTAVNASSDSKTVSTGTVWPTLVRSRIQSMLAATQEPALPTQVPLQLAGLPPARLTLQQADSRNGNMRIAFRLQPAAEPATR